VSTPRLGKEVLRWHPQPAAAAEGEQPLADESPVPKLPEGTL
jgi:hypothetical protein